MTATDRIFLANRIALFDQTTNVIEELKQFRAVLFDQLSDEGSTTNRMAITNHVVDGVLGSESKLEIFWQRHGDTGTAVARSITRAVLDTVDAKITQLESELETI